MPPIVAPGHCLWLLGLRLRRTWRQFPCLPIWPLGRQFPGTNPSQGAGLTVPFWTLCMPCSSNTSSPPHPTPRQLPSTAWSILGMLKKSERPLEAIKCNSFIILMEIWGLRERQDLSDKRVNNIQHTWKATGIEWLCSTTSTDGMNMLAHNRGQGHGKKEPQIKVRSDFSA